MKVELVIYAYLAVCFAMILFNIVCAVHFRRRDRRQDRGRIDYGTLLRQQIALGRVEDSHRQYLLKKLSRSDRLLAFDDALAELAVSDPGGLRWYLGETEDVFIELALRYGRRDRLEAAYFPYLIKKYHLFRPGQDLTVREILQRYDSFRGHGIFSVRDMLLAMVRDSNLYLRENALGALYSLGDPSAAVDALLSMDRSGCEHNSKMLTDGLLSYEGDRLALHRALWEAYPSFSPAMRLTVLNFFRYDSGIPWPERFLEIFTEPRQDDEIRFCCIRYFGRVPYAPARELLLQAAGAGPDFWEYSAITAEALASYPGADTLLVLKKLLTSPMWYVRLNAARSLIRLGQRYEDLIDIIEGPDRYAGEILRYCLDREELASGKAVTA